MRLTKRAYAFLCRQYRRILQQNHFANAVCRGLVAGAVGATIAAGATGVMLGASLECAYADVDMTPTLSANPSYSIVSGVTAGDSSFLTTFTTKDASGAEIVYGVALKTSGSDVANVGELMNDAAKDGLGANYSISYTKSTNPDTNQGTFAVTKGGANVTIEYGKNYGTTRTGNFIGHVIQNSFPENEQTPGARYHWRVRPYVKNFANIEYVTANFVNNKAWNSLTMGPIVDGGALFNGSMNDKSGNTAIMGPITGNFIGNAAQCTGAGGAYNQYGDGGAIANEAMSGTRAIIGDITGNFIGNTATGDGGAISSHSSESYAEIGNITGNFIGNTAVSENGGAISASGTTIGVITGNFIGNYAGRHAGALFLDGSIVGPITGDFIQNTSNFGVGGAISNNGTIHKGADGYAIKGDFIGNMASRNNRPAGGYAQEVGLGGAIYNNKVIDGGILGNFYGNTSEAFDDGGGAIYNDGQINGNITGDFASNTSSEGGGAIFNSYQGVIGDVTGDFTSNVATNKSGGAIHSSGTMGNIYGDFAFNSAGMDGGAIYRRGQQTNGIIQGKFDYNTAGDSGGAIYSTNTYQLIEGDFKNNTATSGAGGALYSSGAIQKIDGLFASNTAGADGGAIYSTAAIGLLESQFTSNKANSGSGGAIYTTSTIGTLLGDLKSNEAGANGGAIYTTSDINTIVGDFESNSAGADGGAIYTASTINAVSGNFIDNHASGKGGAVYNSMRTVGFVADGAGYEFTNNYMGVESADTYNALYLAGDYGNDRATANFTMKNDGTFEINDSILGTNNFAVNIVGDNVTSSTFALNDRLVDNEEKGIYGDLALQNATMNLDSYVHNVGTTYGKVKLNSLTASQNAFINLAQAENTLAFAGMTLDPSATLGVNTAAIGAAPNVTTKSLIMGIGSTLNLTGHTSMQVGTKYGATNLANGTINVGDENPAAAGATTLAFVLPINADAVTINVRGQDSSLTMPDSSYTTNINNGSALTVSETATATLGTDVNVNASSLSVLSGGKAELLDQLEATGSTITVDGANSSLSTGYPTTLLNDGSVFTVSNKGAATLSSLSASGASQFIIRDTQGATLTSSLMTKEGSLVALEDTAAGDGDRTTLTLAKSASFNDSTFTLTEGTTYTTTDKNYKTTFTNGGLIQIKGGEFEDAPVGKGASTYAELNLSGDLVLDDTGIEVTDGADLRMAFNDGAVITAKDGERSVVSVRGAGSSLLITVDSTRPETPPQNVVLSLDDHATFKSDTPAFAFIGGAGLDKVLNVSAFNGSYALFNNAYLSNADIKIADNGFETVGGDGSAFVANAVALEHGTFTVRNSYAQTGQLFDKGKDLETPPAGNTLGGGSALRVAAGGIFVLGDTGTDYNAMDLTSKELYAGLAAFNGPEEAPYATTGVTGVANVKWDGLGYDASGTAVNNDAAHGFSIDGAHSTFIVTSGQTLNIGAGSGLIIDADADDMISGGANDQLIANIPLYIGHDDVLLIDNTDNAYNALHGKNEGVITIKKNEAMDTAYILSTGSKIRVIVNNDVAAQTPANTKFAVIYDENHAGDEAHTAAGAEYHGDIFFTMGDPNALGNRDLNKFDTCSHVGADGEYFDDNRVLMKGPGTVIIENVKLDDSTPTTVATTQTTAATGAAVLTKVASVPGTASNAALVAGDTYTVYEFKMNVEGIKPNFGVEDELFKSLVNVYLAQDTSLQAKDDATRFLTKTTVYATEKHDRDAAIKLGSVTEIAVVGGVANMTHDVMSTSTNALGNYLDYGITTMGAYDEKGSFSLWGIPLYSQSTVDGIKVGSIEGGYETELVAGIMGIDVRNDSGRVGISFTAGVGESSSTRDFLQTQNDTDFYGGGLYGQYKFGNFSVRADLGYYMTEHSLNQESCGYDDYGNVTADVDATILTAGFDASYLYRFNENWALKPHAGVRYSMYNQDEFTSKVNGNDFFITKDADMNLISVPLGVSLLNSFHLGDWTFQPRLDASIIFNFGDTSVDNNITTPNLQSFGTANIEADILDEYILSGSIGLDVNYDAFTFGLDYSLQQSDRRTAHGVFGMVKYEF